MLMEWLVHSIRERGSLEWLAHSIREQGSLEWLVHSIREQGSLEWLAHSIREQKVIKIQIGGIRMKGRIMNQLGEIVINPDVIALYAGTTAVECFGIVGMAAVSMKDGLVKLLKRESLTHGINVEINNNHITLNFHIIVAYGVSICTVADNLIENVKYKVEAFTGMDVEKINIYVEGVRVID